MVDNRCHSCMDTLNPARAGCACTRNEQQELEEIIATLTAERDKLRDRQIVAPGHYPLHSGGYVNWKIECDALTDADVEGLAVAILECLPTTFGAVEGVPRGGLRLAQAMEKYATEGPLLIVDDVCTTGASLEEHRAGREAIGAVIFARGPVPSWCKYLFGTESAVVAERDALRTALEAADAIFRAVTDGWGALQAIGPTHEQLAAYVSASRALGGKS